MSEAAPTLTRVAIHGVPRSGTSWLGEIFNSSPLTVFKYQPLFSYALKDFLTPASSASDIARFFDLLARSDDAFLDQAEQRASGVLPVFPKCEPTHLVYKEVRYHHVLANLLHHDSELRLVAIVRHPLAVLASWLAAPREFRRDLGWREEDEWREAPGKNQGRPEEFYGYEKWKEAARMFRALALAHPHRVRVVAYSDLVGDPEATTRTLFEFCGLVFGEQTAAFLDRSRSRQNENPYSVFRSAASDDKWRISLDPAIVRSVLADLEGTDLERYLGA